MDTKKLRQKILDLAIRGKLVPQDPNDEPASVLLERIRAEKERLIKEGKIKRSKKPASESAEIEAPFEIPESWEWVRLKSIVSVLGDGIHGTPEYDITGSYYFINGNNLSNNKIVIKADTKKVNEKEYQTYKKELNDKTILVSINGTIGNVGHYNGEPIILGKSACYYNLLDLSFKSYITMLMYTDYFLKYVVENATGSTIKNVSLAVMNDFLVPLPPIEEQKRIANEIERWFAVIDALESNEGDLLKAIDQAKSKILDLAIHGKLVPQDPNDEPAIELLRRINHSFEPIDSAKFGIEVPKGWCLTTIGHVCSFLSGNSYPSSDYKKFGIPLIRISNIIDGFISLDDCVYIAPKGERHIFVQTGDILIAMSGATTGKMGVYTSEKPSLLNQRVGVVRITDKRIISERYRNYYMESQSDTILKLAYGGAQPNISGKMISSLLLLLPPLSEQNRIVAKIEELYGVLNEIKESLEK